MILMSRIDDSPTHWICIGQELYAEQPRNLEVVIVHAHGVIRADVQILDRALLALVDSVQEFLHTSLDGDHLAKQMKLWPDLVTKVYRARSTGLDQN